MAFSQLMLVHLPLVLLVQGQKYAELPGDVIVAGIFEVQTLDGSGNCGAHVISSVQAVEAVKWIFQNLNAANYIPGVKLGLWAGKSCRQDEGDSEFAFDLAQRLTAERTSSVPGAPVIGLIGPEYSSEAQTISRFLSALPVKERLLQVAYSTTADILGDHSVYTNFFRVVPFDRLQIQTTVALLQLLEWNRVAIIHEDDVYGSDAQRLLKSSLESVGICVPRTLNIPSSPPYDNDYFLEIIDILTQEKIQGVVFFGSTVAVKTFLTVYQTYPFTEYPTFIFSEGIELQAQALKGPGGALNVAKGAFMLSPTFREIPEFSEHWRKIFTNTSFFMKEAETNPWLVNVFQEENQCTPTMESCAPMAVSAVPNVNPQPLFIAYAIQAAYVMAKAIKTAHTSLCKGISGICPELSQEKGHLISIVQDINVTFNEFAFNLLSLNSVGNILFDKDGNVVLPSECPSYQVHNFVSCGDTAFCIKKVGDFSDGRLSLNTSLVRGYDLVGNERTWPKVVRYATCNRGQTCTDCLPKNRSDAVMYVPGDFLIVALVPIYNKGPSVIDCGDIRSIFSVDIAEGIRYVVEQTNQNPDMFDNKKIGLIVINTCNNGLVVQEKILSLHRNGLKLDNGSYDKTVIDKILGYIGSLNSGETIAASSALTNLNYVQLGYGATAVELSDRNVHPTFIRIPSPDSKQADLMMQIVRALNGNYIQIVYSTGSYGEGGKASLEVSANKFSVCIANTFSVEEGKPFNLVLDEIRNYGHAKIVIIWVSPHLTEYVVGNVTQRMTEGEFWFIGSESWGKDKNVLNRPGSKGSITLSLEMPFDLGFQSYIRSQNVTWGQQTDPWLRTYIEAKFDCYYPWSFDKSGSQLCGTMDELFGDAYEQDVWAAFAIKATSIFLSGAERALKTLCGGADYICDDYQNNPKEVWNLMKTEVFLLNGTLARAFDANGDGMLGYTIYNIQTDKRFPQKLAYAEVGHWLGTGSPNGTLVFDMEQLVTPNDQPVESVCPNEYRCKLCFGEPTNAPEPAPSAAVPVLATMCALLLVALVVLAVMFVRLWHEKPKIKDADDNYDQIDPYIIPVKTGYDDSTASNQTNQSTVSAASGNNSASSQNNQTRVNAFGPRYYVKDTKAATNINDDGYLEISLSKDD